MLNISNNSVGNILDQSEFRSLQRTAPAKKNKRIITIFGLITLLGIGILFVPWTQNIRSYGAITTLKPDQRPQTIHSVLAGRIEKWFVQEGDFVEKGDTILYISEVKSEYFDPQLLDRTQDQLKAKELTVNSYMEKVKALDIRIDALVENSQLKIEQAKNKLQQAHLKVTIDSMEHEAALTEAKIAEERLQRMEALQKQGLKSLSDLESRQLNLQGALANKIAAKNKLLSSRNEVINAQVEMNAVRAKFRDEVAKAESEKYTAMSNMYNSEADLTKLQNQYMNYSIRTGMYYITAPQTGYVTKAIQSGIGETLKEGEAIVSIMPARYDLAVSMYVRPIDLPLVQKGQIVRIQFDGWPAIVFSGWPNVSYGSYGGKIFAIDNFISENGMYRVLVSPDPEDHPWPDALRVGGGTNNLLLLEDVPIGYELWRQINGFPPEFYQAKDQ